MVPRVIATPAAQGFIEWLIAKHGPVLFYQSAGCCDGSTPMCYLRSEFFIGSADVLLGEIAGSPFYIGRQHYDYWKHTQLIIDVVDGEGGTFSLEGGEGRCFLTRSRLFTDEEWRELEQDSVV